MIYLQYAGLFYLSMAFIKFMMAVPSFPVAISVISRLRTGRRGAVLGRYIALIPAIAAVAALIGWPMALWMERGRFFLAYTNFQVMRDAARAWREAHAKS